MSLLLAFQGTTPAEPDFIIEVLSEVPEELVEDLGFTSELIEDVTVEDLIFYLQAELSDDVSEEEGQIEYFIEDDFISSLEASIDEEETLEGFWLSDLIEDETPPEPLEYLLFLIDEGEEELIVPDGWEYVSHAPFDDEPPIVLVTERFNLPFIVTPGRLKSF
jgi:hypothetical protein